MKKIVQIFAIAGLIMFSQSIVSAEKVFELPDSNIKTDNPQTTEFYCRAVLGSSLQAIEEKNSEIIKTKIKGDLFNPTDEFSISVEGDNLFFQAISSLESDQSADTLSFVIVKNNSKKIMALFSNNLINGHMVHVFALDRVTGLAIWSKIRSGSIIGDEPDTQSYYSVCDSK